MHDNYLLHAQVYEANDGNVVELPVLLPSSWLQVLLSKYPFLLSGGQDKDLAKELSSFWSLYEQVQPGHIAFQKSRQDLSSTIPLLLHGDEGRYLKKGNFMCCTIETCLGSDQDKKGRQKKCSDHCSCHEDPVLSRYEDLGQGCADSAAFLEAVETASGQIVNDSGNEFLSKFLVFGVASTIYKKKNAGLLHKAFDLVAKDLTKLHHEGIMIGDKRFFACTLGCKGDLKFHHQIGLLTRSYYNCGTKENHPMCSLCLAGHTDVGFEDLSDTPVWEDTMHLERPWKPNHVPPLANIPFQSSCPEAIFRLDLFHCFKVGLGRDLTGSGMVVCAQLGYFDSAGDSLNIPDRFDRAYSSFKLWCIACGKSPALHSFSRALLNYPNSTSFAWFNVKGCDNTLLTQWLLFVVKLSVQNFGYKYPQFETALIETLTSATIVFGVCHSHGLWLKRTCGARVQHHLTVILRGYLVLAAETQKLGIVAFGLKPKLHALDHINKDLAKQIKAKNHRILNPLMWSCEANESVIGHVSRISRRVSTRTASTRVIDRICIKTKQLLLKFQKNLRHGRRCLKDRSA